MCMYLYQTWYQYYFVRLNVMVKKGLCAILVENNLLPGSLYWSEKTKTKLVLYLRAALIKQYTWFFIFRRLYHQIEVAWYTSVCYKDFITFVFKSRKTLYTLYLRYLFKDISITINFLKSQITWNSNKDLESCMLFM